jgi:hypothetical protein
MGYPAATGQGTSRVDATRARDPAPTAFRRRNSSGISRRQMAVGSGSRSTGMCACFSLRASHGRSGGKGGRGESPAQKHGAVCADHLPKKRTPRASSIFTGALTTVPIKRDSLLRQSVDRKKPAVGPSWPQFSNTRLGSYPSLHEGRIQLFT